MWRMMWGQLKVPEPVSASLLKRTSNYSGWMCLVFAIFNLLSRMLLPHEANVAIYDLFLAINIPIQLVCSGLFLSLSRMTDNARLEQSRKLPIALALTGVNATMGSWIIGGFCYGPKPCYFYSPDQLCAAVSHAA